MRIGRHRTASNVMSLPCVAVADGKREQNRTEKERHLVRLLFHVPLHAALPLLQSCLHLSYSRVHAALPFRVSCADLGLIGLCPHLHVGRRTTRAESAQHAIARHIHSASTSIGSSGDWCLSTESQSGSQSSDAPFAIPPHGEHKERISRVFVRCVCCAKCNVCPRG